MGSSSVTVVWFRRDLRIEDNPALAAAAKDGSVFPVYIWCPNEEEPFYPGRASRWWLKQSLAHLRLALRSLGVELTLIKAERSLDALLECVCATGASKVVFNHLYDPVSLVRDHKTKQKLVDMGITVESYNGDLLFEPWEVYDDNGHAFTTFNTYWDKCMSMQMEPSSIQIPLRLVAAAGYVKSCQIDQLGLENESEKSSNALLGRAWSPGWTSANKALTEFVENHLHEYFKTRTKVEGNSSSLLSPYIHFGELSVKKIFHTVSVKQLVWAKEGDSSGLESITLFIRAIGLREYSRYLCFNFPFTHERSLISSMKYYPWTSDHAYFKAWRQGRTGYPLVDAGMRELWATGWIHNRMRVIVSSFCVKFLLLPWRWGMKYFWDTLLDADLECDILGWQYISGSLPDGHDLNRLDDPEVQGSKFDPNGEYVRQWLPELARLPTDWIHHPWNAPYSVLKAAGVELGSNYPKPIVEVDLARERLTEAIVFMQGKAGAEMAENADGTNEKVVDNSDNLEKAAIPVAVLKEKVVCPSRSFHDQRVPSMQSSKNVLGNRKRSIFGKEKVVNDNMQSINNNAGTSRVDEEFYSTANSSSVKKQVISGSSFSVPKTCSRLSEDEVSLDCESSDLSESCPKQIDAQQCSEQDDK